MLSDRDREVLREIQCRLLADDPAFARDFSTDARLLEDDAPSGDPATSAFTLPLLLSLGLGVLSLVGGSGVGGLVFSGMAAGFWWLRERHDAGTYGP
ncbi:DUF3040 domain-containing protein [Nonomuraea ceibae]|uniref:DUF3040 domain-containing protein n=1 Tax=Nonomuraea ceibae TaxID=1935170 RepID=UPI001C5DA3C9|nr:DUF3040 domain-containing protein [Nonomuraea ceibae]